MVERLHAKLGYPDRCPHGWPVAPDQERAESRELVSLADLGKGDSGEIVRQSEQDGGLLSWFEAEGLKPGARVEVRDIQPAAGHLRSRSAASSSSSPIAPRAGSSCAASRARSSSTAPARPAARRGSTANPIVSVGIC